MKETYSGTNEGAIRSARMEDQMATPRKRWPNEAEWARLDAVAGANRAWRILNEVLDELVEVDQVRRVARAMSELQEIRYKLTTCKGTDGEQESE